MRTWEVMTSKATTSHSVVDPASIGDVVMPDMCTAGSSQDTASAGLPGNAERTQLQADQPTGSRAGRNPLTGTPDAVIFLDPDNLGAVQDSDAGRQLLQLSPTGDQVAGPCPLWFFSHGGICVRTAPKNAPRKLSQLHLIKSGNAKNSEKK